MLFLVIKNSCIESVTPSTWHQCLMVMLSHCAVTNVHSFTMSAVSGGGGGGGFGVFFIIRLKVSLRTWTSAR